jgi:hypothetical protein
MYTLQRIWFQTELRSTNSINISLVLFKSVLKFAVFASCVSFTEAYKLLVITLDGRTFYFTSAAIIKQLL